jgi:3-deoxy-manno-octulosonate cytidylyltransferase (CMP-KDO synthetase)
MAPSTTTMDENGSRWRHAVGEACGPEVEATKLSEHYVQLSILRAPVKSVKRRRINPGILLKRRLNQFTMSGTPIKAIAVIPARLASTRLSRKMLREIAGKPLIGVVYEAVRSSPLLGDVIIATDSEEILQVCRERDWKAQMTSSAHRSGTERVHEVSGREAADVYINVQGDEPLVRPEQIATLLQVMENPAVQVGTLMTPAAEVDIPNPNAVKVVTDLGGRALYFSRATIPFDRDGTRPRYCKHLGFYAYRKPALDRFVTLPESSLEKSERLEQLRFLENGISIYVGETPHDSVGVDTEEDLQRVIKILGSR